MMQFTEEQRKALSQERLKELLSYDPGTGLFTWKVSPGGGVRVGDKAGTIDDSGYVRICIKKVGYKAHRLAFLYMENRNPSSEIDHINRNKIDNAWANLREVTRSENMINRDVYRNNLCGIRGVNYRRDTGKYRVQLRLQGCVICFGSFDDIELAELVAMEARAKHHAPIKVPAIRAAGLQVEE